jgi:hypothetical protein
LLLFLKFDPSGQITNGSHNNFFTSNYELPGIYLKPFRRYFTFKLEVLVPCIFRLLDEPVIKDLINVILETLPQIFGLEGFALKKLSVLIF